MTATDLTAALSQHLQAGGLQALRVEPMHLAGAPSPAEIGMALLPWCGLVMALLPAARLPTEAVQTQMRRWTKRAVVGLALIAAALIALMVPEDLILQRAVVATEGNSNRLLLAIYHLFHPEPLRSAAALWLADLAGSAAAVPLIATIRLALLGWLLAVPLMAWAALRAGRHLGLATVAVAGLALSPTTAALLLSDSPAGWAATYAAAALLGLMALLNRKEKSSIRLVAGLGALICQLAHADLRAEALALWLPADALAMWCVTTARSPVELGAALRQRLVSRWLAASRARRILVVIGTVAAVGVLPWVLSELPFWVLDRPRLVLVFPFFLPLALWGAFVPALIKLQPMIPHGLWLLLTVCTLASLVAPVRALGLGIMVLGLMSGHWYLSLSHTHWQFARLMAPVLPVALMAGLWTLAGLSSRHKTRLAALTLLVLVAGVGLRLAGHGAAQVGLPGHDDPLAGVDDVEEARFVAEKLAAHPERCVLAPVLRRDLFRNYVVPERDQEMRLLVLRADAAIAIDGPLHARDPGLLKRALQAAHAACGDSVLYLGLDCSLRGAHHCADLAADRQVSAQRSVAGPQHTAPREYGERLPERTLRLLR